MPGCGVYPASITTIELAEDMLIRLVRWKTYVNDERLLYIKRETMRGPEPIEVFDTRKPQKVVEYLALRKNSNPEEVRERRAAFREAKMSQDKINGDAYDLNER